MRIEEGTKRDNAIEATIGPYRGLHDFKDEDYVRYDSLASLLDALMRQCEIRGYYRFAGSYFVSDAERSKEYFTGHRHVRKLKDM